MYDRLGDVAAEVEELGDEADEYVDQSDLRSLTGWLEWLAQFPAARLRNFYAAMGRLAQQSRNPYARGTNDFYWYTDPFPDSLAAAPLIRVQSGGGIDHVRGPQAFLPTNRDLRGDGLVVDAVVPFADPGEEAETKAHRAESSALTEFFSNARVKTWDAAAQLDARLKTYEKTPPEFSTDHLNDLATLAQLLDEKAVSSSSYANRAIFLVESASGLRWAPAARIYLDEPFTATGLHALYGSPVFDGTKLFPLADHYRESAVDVARLVSDLGATTRLEIQQIKIWNNPLFENSWRWSGRENQNLVSRDWILPHFKAIVDTYDEDLLASLWNLIARADAGTAQAVYRANASTHLYRIDSQLIQALRATPWILDRDGNLRSPRDITEADLAVGLSMPANAPLLEAAHFGQAAKLAATVARGDEERAKTLGFESAEQAREAARAIKEAPEAFASWLSSRHGPDLPEASSPAPERRAQRVRDQAIDALERQYATRLRSVRIQEPGYRSTSKEYLTSSYTNDDGVMVCQICDREMPFKVNDQYYFEAVQFMSDAQHDLHENRLALCPLCAAKYRHARSTSLEDLRDDLLTQDVGASGSLSVDVTLAGDEGRIRFVGKHAIDLQAALEGSMMQSISEESDDELGPGGASPVDVEGSAAVAPAQALPSDPPTLAMRPAQPATVAPRPASVVKPRVHEIASELGIDSKIALAKLKELGEFVRGPSSSLEPSVARKLRAALDGDAAATEG